MEYSLTLIAGIFFVGACVQGATGFGSGLIIMASLSPIYGTRNVSILIAIPIFVLTLLVFWKLRKHFSLKNIKVIFISALLAVPLGVYLLEVAKDQEGMLQVFLGCLMLAAGIQNLLPKGNNKPWHPIYAGAPFGILAGLFGGAMGTGGPPLVAYLSTQKIDRFQFSVTLQGIAATMVLTRILSFCYQGAFTEELLLTSGFASIFVVLGVFTGLIGLKKMSDKILKKIVLIFLITMGSWRLIAGVQIMLEKA